MIRHCNNRRAVTGLCLLLAACLLFPTVLAPFPAQAAHTTSEKEIDYMNIKNLTGPSGVALGGIGVGYYEIDPTGHLTRCCVNNIHKSFTDCPDGMIVAVHDGKTAARLQRDNTTLYGMKGYADSYYTGLWPTVSLSFENHRAGVANMGFSAFSGAVAQNVTDSALPVVHYEVTLTNDKSTPQKMSALISWGDLIGRGIRDNENETITQYDGESSEWHDMPTPATYAKGVTLQVGDTTYVGVKQYAKEQILPQRATFQNYNNAFMLLAEQREGATVTILPSFGVKDDAALSGYVKTGALNGYNETEVALSAATNGARTTEKGSAVAISTEVGAGESVTVRFAVSWYMPEITEAQYANMYRFASCDYNKYYHNQFSSIEALTSYALGKREEIRAGIDAWQQPLLQSSLPDWLIFKQINSGYTLYTNGVLNKKGNFSTLEGEMGGYGGTMDQKMSSYAFYEKMFPSLNLTENRQYANVTGANGEIQHFDIHYYYGMADYDPAHTANPTPAGSMTDNAGSWMMQMWNYYAQTGDDAYLRKYYDVMKTSMAFVKSKCQGGTAIPNYNTTYDDYSHPPIMIYSGTVWLCMLRLGAKWATLMGDDTLAAQYLSQYDRAAADVQVLYDDWQASLGYGGFYAFGSDYDFITSGGKSGSAKNDTMFSGAMAGQYMSRLLGQGDVLPFDQFVSHMQTFLATSVQKSNDYYAPKVYNLRIEQDMDNPGSRCWPFYLDSYGGMAAITAGYLEDGLEILEHTMLVDLRQGYMWTQNLWNRGYATYMTTTVSWMLGDVLAGAALDVPGRTLTLGPSIPSSTGVGQGDALCIPLYYPKYWATLRYSPAKGEMTYEITKTFYADGESPITIDTVIATPAGKASSESVRISLADTFTAETGAVLDLSAHVDAFVGVTQDKLLEPVGEYVKPQQEVIAIGKGLAATVTANGKTSAFTATDINYTFDTQNLPAPGVNGEYTLQLRGKLLPRYSQKYQLIFEYTGEKGDLSVKLDGKEITDYGTEVADVESQQFVPTTGCRLMVITTPMTAGAFTGIEITYRGDISDGADRLKLLWWSTTQQMGTIITERMYPPTKASDDIIGVDATVTDCTREGDHMGYTMQGYRAIYRGVDFGEGGTDYILKINAGAPDSEVSRGGTMEIRLGDEKGALLGTLDFTPTGGWANYREFRANLHSDTPLTGEQDICLVFRPISTFLFNYTTFTFVEGHDDGIPTPGEDDATGGTVADRWIDGVDFAKATAQIEGDHMAYTTKNTYASYLVDFADGCDACTFRIRAAAPNNEVSGGGVLEVRLGDAKGELLGSIDFEPTGEWANYREFSVGLEDVSELYDEVTLTLVFLPEKQYLLNYSELMFDVEFDEPKQPDAPVDEPTPEPEDKPEPPEETPTEQPDDQPTTPQPEKTSSATPWLIGGAAALVAAIGGVLALLVGKKKKER